MDVTFFGTTTLLFDDEKDQVLFDGHVTRPAISKLLFSKLEPDEIMAEAIMNVYHFDRVRSIFVSHSHYDHVLDVPNFAKRTGAVVYGSPSTRNVMLGAGIPEEKIRVFEKYETYQVGDFSIKVLPAVHSPAKWYNNDLGQTIDEPLIPPGRKSQYKEGGSHDFLVENGGQRYLIHPSFNYIEGQLDNVRADILFLSLGAMGKAPQEMVDTYFEETVAKVQPKKVIPVHWDNFFTPLDQPVKEMPKLGDSTKKAMFDTAQYCSHKQIEFIIQYPLIKLHL